MNYKIVSTSYRVPGAWIKVGAFIYPRKSINLQKYVKKDVTFQNDYELSSYRK